MTLDKLLDKYELNETDEQLAERIAKMESHSTRKKWNNAVWLIQSVWGYVNSGNITLSKARELTASIIESESIKTNNNGT